MNLTQRSCADCKEKVKQPINAKFCTFLWSSCLADRRQQAACEVAHLRNNANPFPNFHSKRPNNPQRPSTRKVSTNYSMTTLKDLQVTLAAFAAERDWDQWHTPENLAKSISIEAAELLECYQWGKEPDPQAVRHELADVLIYCLQMARRLGVDPAEIILEKLEVTRKKYPATVKNKDAGEGSSNGAEGEQNSAV